MPSLYPQTITLHYGLRSPTWNGGQIIISFHQ